MQEKAKTAQARSQLYALFSLVYRREPQEEFLDLLSDPKVQTAFSDSGLELPKMAEKRNKALEELAVEYTRLFLGPGPHVSPHESVFSEGEGRGLLWGPETADVKRFMEASGLKLDESSSFIPDHVTVELEFMQWLSGSEAQAWEKGDEETARECLKGEIKFLDEHLGKWFPKFAKAVKEADPHPFYKEITAVAQSFISQDLDDLRSYSFRQ